MRITRRAVAERLETEHHEATYTQENAMRVLPKVVRAIESFDPSLVRNAVPNYILAEFTAQYVKVVLTGEGADESFADHLGRGPGGHHRPLRHRLSFAKGQARSE